MVISLLLCVAFVLLLLSGLDLNTGRIKLGWLGLACWVLTLVLVRFGG